MDDSNPLPGLVRQVLIGAGFFVLGGLLALGFSYRPLYGSLTWKVEALEERLDERNRENLALGDELAGLRAQEGERIDPDQFAQLERDLEKARQALAQAEKDRDRASRKRKDANASASRWRKRYETLRDQTSAASAVAPAAPAGASSPAARPADSPSNPSSAASPQTRPAPGSNAGGDATGSLMLMEGGTLPPEAGVAP